MTPIATSARPLLLSDVGGPAGAGDPPLAHAELVAELERLAAASLPLWDVPAGASVRLINLSENATFLIEAGGVGDTASAAGAGIDGASASAGWRSVLRIHRVGYHSKRAIESELAWLDALRREAGVITPEPIPGRNGAAIQTAAGGRLVAPRHMVMFRFIEGIEPDETMDLARPFVRLGEISARLHEHALHWQRPAGFERLAWDADHIFLPGANWGDWRAAPAMDAPTRAVLERLERAVRRRLAAFGQAPTRFNLIHADIRLANLLIDGESTRVIDFDDCGFGWFLYDVATTVSFIEDHPKVPEWIAAWCEGYRRVRPLPGAEEAEIPTFVLLRRMALLAWIGSHSETDLAKAQGAAFTRVSGDLAENYLARFG